MMKYIIAACAAIVAGSAFFGATAEAEAGYGRCGHCGPVGPSYTYRTVNKVVHRTRYRDVSRTRYVHRIKKVVHVTRIRPIIRVHQVTRVHHHTVAVVRPVHVSRTVYLPARTITTGSVRHSYDCGCGGSRWGY